MKKEEMTERTISGFIRKLERDGFSKYASELRYIVAMSRDRKDALASLSGMTITLLIHLIKYVAMPQSRDSNKWCREINSYLNSFNVRNTSPKGQPWLSIDYIQKDLNDVLSSPKFLSLIEKELEDSYDKNKVVDLLRSHKTLKSLEVKLFFDSNNDLRISVKDQEL